MNVEDGRGQAVTGAENLRRPRGAADLSEVSIAEVLLYGLTLGDDNPALGVLSGARRDLGLLVSLAECGVPGREFDIGEIAPVLESLGRRLDVAIELMTRSRRSATSGEAAERGAPSPLNGGGAP